MHASRGSNWKLWVLIIVLVIAVLVLAFLLVQYFFPDLLPLGSLGSLRSKPAEPVTVLSTTVSAQDAEGRNVTDSLSITEGTVRPDIAEEDAELLLLNIDWAGKREANLPFIISVTNPAFQNDDGLAVYHQAEDGWELIGTYLIADNTVSFRTTSLSPFAFEVISSEPEPTPTAEPTATPEPTVTPEPTATPYIIDYGFYSTVQGGTFEQADAIEEGGSYVIAIVEDPTADAGNGGVTFFDTGAAQEPIIAHVLLNYDGETMRTIDVKLSKNASGRYSILDPVVEGMLWTAVDSYQYSGVVRFAMANNEKYLNTDDKVENIIMNDNADRTRWYYDTITQKGENNTEKKISTLTYRENLYDEYYISAMNWADDSGLTFSAVRDADSALPIVLFRMLQLSEGEYFTGTVILTGTPDALSGLDATPDPNVTPSPTPDTHGGAVIPVTNPPASATSTPVATNPPAPTNPPEYTVAPDPTAAPPVETSSGGAASGSDAGGDTGGGGDSGGSASNSDA